MPWIARLCVPVAIIICASASTLKISDDGQVRLYDKTFDGHFNSIDVSGNLTVQNGNLYTKALVLDGMKISASVDNRSCRRSV